MHTPSKPRMPIVPGLLAAAVLLLLPLFAIATNFGYCNDRADYPVKVNSAQMSQFSIETSTGIPFTFNLSANTRDEISAGELNIESLCGIGYVEDICGLTACPVPIGDFTLTFMEIFPDYCAVAIWIGPVDNLKTCIFVEPEPPFAS